jgi:ABC-type polar amino acid transport system ATPase subunit
LETKEMIKVEKLNKSFGDLHVLKDIDLKVNELQRIWKKHPAQMPELS